MNRCPTCAAELPEGSRFCPASGRVVFNLLNLPTTLDASASYFSNALLVLGIVFALAL